MIKERTPPTARRFVDKVVMVTGAAGAIGSAISERPGAEGAIVHVCPMLDALRSW
jgi:2-hydroxycyclohexanecarboxyl-CoA dehydrogenase